MTMTMPKRHSNHTSSGTRRVALGSLFVSAAWMSAALLQACGGSNVSCGEGTEQQGNTCVAKSPISQKDGGGTDGAAGADSGGSAGGTSGSGGTTSDSGPASGGGGTTSAGGDAGTVPKDAIQFDGATSASPANQSPPAGSGSTDPADAIRITWNAASYPGHPDANFHYEIFYSESSGQQNFSTPQEVSPPGTSSFLVQGLDATKKYFFVVRAVADQGQAKDRNTAEVSAKPAFDDAPPTFDGITSATGSGSRSVLVKWKAAKDDHTAPEGIVYRVYWSATSNGAREVGAISTPGATEVNVAGLPAPDTEFFFRVVAVDAAGNADANGVDLSGKTSKDTVPPVFAGCTSASEPSANSATLVWAPASDDTTAPDQITYDVYASDVPITKDTDFKTLLQVGSFVGGTTGRIHGLNAATRYRLVCRAKDAAGNEDANRAAQVIETKSDGQPPTFTGAATLVPGATTVDLTWPQAHDNETADKDIVYRVYASADSGAEPFSKAPIATISGATGMTVPKESLTKITASDPDLQKAISGGHVSNTKFYFVVRAVDEAGNEDGNTNELSGTTLVSFADDVQPIFSGNCAINICHWTGVDGTNPPIQGQNLDVGQAYTNIHNVVAREGVAIGEPNIKRVDGTSTDKHQSYLWRKITGTQPITGSQMPPAASQHALTDAQKLTIENWIVQGSQDN
jgi:hypothetical protein